MSHQSTTRSNSGLTVTGILLGGLTGGVIGALVRGGITFYNMREGAEFGFLASLPSAGIGFLCGAVAGCCCSAWLGALWGAFLSALVFGLFVLPFAYAFSLFNAADKVGDFTWPYFVQKAIAGAIAGGVGGFVGWLIVTSEKGQQTNKERSGGSE